MDLVVLKELAEAPGATALYDEVDRDGAFVHRILFIVHDGSRRGSYRDLVIRFEDINITQVSRPDRDLDRIGSRYVQVGEGTA
jgi:hypothetical protein